MKHRYKVLPLEELGPYAAIRGMFDYETAEEFLEGYHGKGYERVEPVFFREGSYYARIEKRAWYEMKHDKEWIAVAQPASYFIYSFEKLEAETARVPDVCMQAIRTLEIYGFGSPRLRNLAWTEKEVREHKEMLREILSWRHQVLKEN